MSSTEPTSADLPPRLPARRRLLNYNSGSGIVVFVADGDVDRGSAELLKSFESGAGKGQLRTSGSIV